MKINCCDAEGRDASMTRPLELVAGILFSCLERGRLHMVQLPPSCLSSFLHCTLAAQEPADALLYNSMGMWSVVQVSETPFLALTWYNKQTGCSGSQKDLVDTVKAEWCKLLP